MEFDQFYLVGKVALASFIVSAGHLKILFHFYFPEYDMDWKSLVIIPLKTFVPASIIAIMSLFLLDYIGGGLAGNHSGIYNRSLCRPALVCQGRDGAF